MVLVKKTALPIAARDVEFVQDLACRQVEAGFPSKYCIARFKNLFAKGFLTIKQALLDSTQ
jgi:hypothetical protein